MNGVAASICRDAPAAVIHTSVPGTFSTLALNR